MESVNTVTISIEEYFELRQKAEMNGILMLELGNMGSRLDRLQQDLNNLEYEVRSKKF